MHHAARTVKIDEAAHQCKEAQELARTWGHPTRLALNIDIISAAVIP